MTGDELSGSEDEETASMFEAVPLLVFIVVSYSAYVLITGAQDVDENLQAVLFDWQLASGRNCSITVNALFIGIAFALLFQEILRAAFNDERTVPNHFLSFFVMMLSLYVFFFVEPFGTSAFLFISIATVFDVVAGVYITIRSKPSKETPLEIVVKPQKKKRRRKRR